MKIENLKEINRLYVELKENKAKLKIIENECSKMNNEQMTLKDNELLANVRALALVHILKRIKEIEKQLKELGVEVDEWN